MIDHLYTDDYGVSPIPTIEGNSQRSDHVEDCSCQYSERDNRHYHYYHEHFPPYVGGTDDGDALVHHARVYTLGHMYDVASLRERAMQKFAEISKDRCHSAKFPIAVFEIYTTTPETDRGLRDVVVGTILQHNALLDIPELQTVMQDTRLGYDLVMAAHNRKTTL